MSLLCKDCGYEVNEKFTRTYFLAENSKFTKRTLKVGYCFRCSAQIGDLKETRISDGKVFTDRIKGIKLRKLITKEKKNVLHIEYGPVTKYKDDWVYGINKEIKDRSGNVIEIRQYASYFNGKKELVKSIGKRV